MSLPRRDDIVPHGQLGVGRNDSQLLLTSKRPLALHIPTVIELAAVLVRPLFGDVMGGMRGAGREVHEEGLVRHQRLLLTHPTDRLVGEVLGRVGRSSSAVAGGSIGVVPLYSAGSHWLFSPPMNP